jgi:hypothetical protein
LDVPAGVRGDSATVEANSQAREIEQVREALHDRQYAYRLGKRHCQTPKPGLAAE